MTNVVSTIRQDENGKLTITSPDTATWYLYPPFVVLHRELAGELTTVVLRAGNEDHVLFVREQGSLDVLGAFRLVPDEAAAKSAQERHAAWQERAARTKESPSGSSAATQPPAPVPPTVPPGGPGASPTWSANWASAGGWQGSGSVPSAAARRAHNVAGIVEVLAWLGAIVGIIVGIAVAAQTTNGGDYGNPTHPNVAAGLIIAVFSAVQALPTIMISAYIQSRTE